ncbi:hypothetical protein [Xenorhabdus bovienii]|uniref:hypothetical protein n=1 Tax=Xenorhabdus bovienii TaxID=40576 RepID=UPI0023B35244|nr:hypothetical protein [Xenorhabdus bovienii]
MKNHKFYMACLRDTVGSNMACYCVYGAGYTTDISKAHIYSRKEAQRSWDSERDIDLPVLQYWVDAFLCFMLISSTYRARRHLLMAANATLVSQKGAGILYNL